MKTERIKLPIEIFSGRIRFSGGSDPEIVNLNPDPQLCC